MAESHRKRPEMAECFYLTNGQGEQAEVPCEKCGKRAVVKDGDTYYCNRDWEFLPRE